MVYSCKRRMNEVDGWNLQDHLTSIHLLVGYVIIDLDLHNLFEHTHLYQRKDATSQFLNVIAASYVIKQESHSPPAYSEKGAQHPANVSSLQTDMA